MKASQTTCPRRYLGDSHQTAPATTLREAILGDVRRLEETEEGDPSLTVFGEAASTAEISVAWPSSALSRLLTSSRESESVLRVESSACTSWLSALALRLLAAVARTAGDDASASEALVLVSFASASSWSSRGSMVMALAARGLLWKGAVEANPWWFLLTSGGLVPRESELRFASSSAGAADPERVPARLADTDA